MRFLAGKYCIVSKQSDSGDMLMHSQMHQSGVDTDDGSGGAYQVEGIGYSRGFNPAHAPVDESLRRRIDSRLTD